MVWLLCEKLEHCDQRIAFGGLIEAVGQESEAREVFGEAIRTRSQSKAWAADGTTLKTCRSNPGRILATADQGLATMKIPADRVGA